MKLRIIRKFSDAASARVSSLSRKTSPRVPSRYRAFSIKIHGIIMRRSIVNTGRIPPIPLAPRPSRPSPLGADGPNPTSLHPKSIAAATGRLSLTRRCFLFDASARYSAPPNAIKSRENIIGMEKGEEKRRGRDHRRENVTTI